MFRRLQQKWGVSTRQFWVIFIAFGCTGTTTAYLTKAITGWLGMGPHTWLGWKILLKLVMLLFGYQVLLLLFGALFGQWRFFWTYEKKLLQRLRLLKAEPTPAPVSEPITERKDMTSPVQAHNKTRLALFASGAGSNARKIMERFANHPTIEVALVLCNRPGAGVLNIAAEFGVPTLLVERERFFRGDHYLPELQNRGVRFIVLAGFLWKVPEALVKAYPRSIVNIHPALLPKYGGKGMYGHHVHQAVIAAGEKVSGITIHYVDEHYDNGDVILQASCEVLPHDTPETLASRVHQLEHAHFAPLIEEIVLRRH